MNIARQQLAAACKMAHTKSELGRRIGVSGDFIGKVLRGHRRPGPRVLAFLGLEAYEAYRPKSRRLRTSPARCG